MRSVCWAAMIVLLFSPESLVGPGFQMSFAAVTALIAVYGWASDRRRADIERHRHRGIIGKGARYFGSIMLTTLIAGLATSPFAVYHFQDVAIFGLITNAIADPSPPFGLCQPVSLQWSACHLVSMACRFGLFFKALILSWPVPHGSLPYPVPPLTS